MGGRLSFLLVLPLVAGCGGSEPAGAPAPEPPIASVPLAPQTPADSDEVESSGRSLAGVYVLRAPSPPDVAATWTFTADGAFSRSRTLDRGRGERRDAGTYVVDTSGRLVLFVEQRGDARLAWAERMTFALGGDPATGITLTTLDGRAETLVRTATPPPSE